jgi:hypothetical protein
MKANRFLTPFLSHPALLDENLKDSTGTGRSQHIVLNLNYAGGL